MIEFRILGLVDVREAGRTVAPEGSQLAIPGQPKRLALLAYLVLSGRVGPVLRDPVLALFWPESADEQARNALNQSIYSLRRSLGPETIRTHGTGALSVDRDRLWCDAVAFHEAFEGGGWSRALELYRGALLPGLHVSGCPDFERWLDEERRRCHRRAREAAGGLADEALEEGNLVGAARWLERATRLDPHDEALARRHVDLLLELGDRAGALKTYRRFEAGLDDLGLPSSDPSGTWLHTIREGRGVPADPPTDGPPASSEAVDDPVTTGVSREDHLDDGPGRGEGGGGRPRSSAPVFVGLAVIAALGAVWVATQGGDPPRRGQAGAAAVGPAPRRVLVSTLYEGSGVGSPPELGALAAEWIALELTRTGLVQAIPEPLLAEGGRGGDAPTFVPDDSSVLALARRADAEIAVRGAVVRAEDTLVAEAALIDVTSGSMLRSVEPVTAPATDPWHVVEQLRDRVSGALGTVIDPRLRAWSAAASQPPSFEAYRLYAAGLDAFQSLDFEAAREHFLAAARSDSSFTSPVVWAMQLPSLGFSEVDSLGRPLEARRSKLAPWDRLMLDARLAEVRGDRASAYRSMLALAELVPRSYWWTRTAELALELNAPTAALQHLERAEPFGPHPVAPTGIGRLRAAALHRLGRYAEERKSLADWAEAAPEAARWVELRALSGLGRTGEVEARISARFADEPWSRTTADRARVLAGELRAHGDSAAAQRVLERLVAWYETAPESVWEDAEQYLPYARTLALAGRRDQARILFVRLLEEGVLPEVVRGDLGVIAARSGDREEAERMAAWFEEASDRWAPYGNGWYKQWEARIAAALGDRERAVALLEESYDRGWAHLTEDHLLADWESLRGYPPFEEITAVR